MIRCSRPGCGWRAVAPSATAGWNQYAEHLVAEHTSEVEATVPEGMVQVKLGDDGEWVTTTVEEAGALHDAVHDG